MGKQVWKTKHSDITKIHGGARGINMGDTTDFYTQHRDETETQEKPNRQETTNWGCKKLRNIEIT